MLKELGENKLICEQIHQKKIGDFNTIARIIAVHKERYIIKNEENIYRAEITGRIRYSSSCPKDFPTVGDWVQVLPIDEENMVITDIFERSSILERKSINRFGQSQIIAANVDFAFIVMSVNYDFNLNRLDRYIAICHSAKIQPILIISKTDLVESDQLKRLKESINHRYSHLQISTFTTDNPESTMQLTTIMLPYKTYCFIGSSGVGKTTIINRLIGTENNKTREISESNHKGKHTTSRRELFFLSNGSIVIDTPGMREIGVLDDDFALADAFDQIHSLSHMCTFSDCNHVNNEGCAILKAVAAGDISTDQYHNFIKLSKEEKHFSQDVHQRRKEGKKFTKMIKEVKNYKGK